MINIFGEVGDVMEVKGWLQWKKVDGLIEVKVLVWYFQIIICYKVEDERFIFVEYQDVGVKVFYFGMVVGLLLLMGLYLCKFWC